MFGIDFNEWLVLVLVTVVVIGPKDLPVALRTAGKWIGKMRRMSAHFQAGLEAMIREAELEEMEKKWREQNAAIMAQTPAAAPAEPAPPAAIPAHPASGPVPEPTTEHPSAAAEAAVLSHAELEQFHAHMPATDPAPAANPVPEPKPLAPTPAP